MLYRWETIFVIRENIGEETEALTNLPVEGGVE